MQLGYKAGTSLRLKSLRQSVDIQGHMFGNITHVKLTHVKLISKYSTAVKLTQEHMTHVNIFSN